MFCLGSYILFMLGIDSFSREKAGDILNSANIIFIMILSVNFGRLCHEFIFKNLRKKSLRDLSSYES